MKQTTWQWTPYVLPLLAAAATSILLALHVVRRRPDRVTSRTGALLLVASAVWTLGYALELSSVDLHTKILWAKVQYAGIGVFPLFWLTYALRYAGHEHWLTSGRRLLLAIVPISTFALALTTEAHGLMWGGATLGVSGPYVMLVQDFGPGFWAFLVYANALIVAGFVVLIRTFVESRRLHRSQIRVLLLGAFTLGAAVLLDAFDLVPTGGLDLEPFAAALLAAIVAWGLFRLHLGDIVPVAHESIVSGLSDSVLVLDEENRVLAVNPAARDLMGAGPEGIVGKPVAMVWPEWQMCMAGASHGAEGHWEWTREGGDQPRTYEVNVSGIQDAKDSTVSRVVTLHDMTEYKRAEEALCESEERFKTLFRLAPDAYYLSSLTGTFVDGNQAAEALIGYEREDLIGKSFVDAQLLPVAQLPKAAALLARNKMGQATGPDDFTLQRSDGRAVEVEIRTVPVRIQGQDLVLGIVRDVSGRKEAEREIRDRRRYLEGVLEAAPDAIVTLDAQGRVVEWNSAAVHLFGYSPAEAIGQGIDSVITGPAALEGVRALTRQAFGERGVPPAETVCQRKDGSPIHVVVAGAPICSDGELIGVVIVYTDISEHKRLEHELRGLNEELERRVAERTSRLSQMNDELVRAIEEHEQAQSELLRRNRELLSLQAAIAATASSLDLPFVLDTVTWEMASMLGVERCAVLHLDEQNDVLSVLARHDATSGEEDGSRETYALAQHPIRRWLLDERTALQMTIGQPNADTAEVRYMRETGAKCLLMQPMVFQDRVVGLVEITDNRSERTFTDQEVSLAQLFSNQAASAIENARLYERAQQEIAERLRAEEQITASLREKEVMLKEIHHRVKNNLQVISSLLHLQSRSIDDQEILEIFQESQHRVRSMALIHEKLYRSEDLARVDFGSYIQDLASFLFRSYRSQRGAVHLSVDADGVSLPIDTAVPCGLIINELVSNALKHAFGDGREGQIRVTLGADEARRILLTVSDNGVGFPADVDFRGTPSLGMQLVNTLVEQLDGEIELYNGKGTRFEIRFAVP